MMTDPIADMLTRIRNGTGARKASVDVPWSRHKEAIAARARRRGLPRRRRDGPGGAVPDPPRSGCATTRRRRPVISGIRRVSRPSLRVYVGTGEIPRCAGARRQHPSTPKGILPDREARRQGVGGEVICQVW